MTQNIDVPHFDLPFRFGADGGVVEAEQDSYEDIANCVETIMRTPLGFRIDALDFGFPQLELTTQPIISPDVANFIQAQEPRSVLLIAEKPDVVDTLIDRVIVEIT